MDGKPSFENADKTGFIYWTENLSAWILHTDLKGQSAAIYSRAKEPCPNLVPGWQVFDGKWRKGKVTIQCLDLPDEKVVKSLQESTSAKAGYQNDAVIFSLIY